MLKKWEYVPGVGRKELPVKRLYRYMPLDACRRMVECGDVRVSSSTSFTDEALTATRRDDEQTQSVKASMSKVLGAGNVPKGFQVDVRTESADGAEGGEETTFRTTIEDSYWILSLTTDLTLDLFDEFDETAAVEISDPERFLACDRARRFRLQSRRPQHVEATTHFHANGFGRRVAGKVRLPIPRPTAFWWRATSISSTARPTPTDWLCPPGIEACSPGSTLSGSSSWVRNIPTAGRPTRPPRVFLSAPGNVPTYHTTRQRPETAENQLDYVFASRGFHKGVRVRALNEPDEWGPSDHCRLAIEVDPSR